MPDVDPRVSWTWAFFPLGYLFTILIETPVLVVGLSRRHSLRDRLFAGVWLTACTYPIVVLVLPLLIDPRENRTLYLWVAETFAPVAECVLFWLAFGKREEWLKRSMFRDLGVVVLANLASFGLGEVANHYELFQRLLPSRWQEPAPEQESGMNDHGVGRRPGVVAGIDGGGHGPARVLDRLEVQRHFGVQVARVGVGGLAAPGAEAINLGSENVEGRVRRPGTARAVAPGPGPSSARHEHQYQQRHPPQPPSHGCASLLPVVCIISLSFIRRWAA